VQHLLDFHKLNCFLGGLKDELRVPMRMFNPKMLVDAYSLARMLEECVLNSKRYSRSSSYSSQFQHRTQGLSVQLPTNFSKGNSYPNPIQDTVPGQINPNLNPPIRGGLPGWEGPKPSQALVPVQKISQAQMEDRRHKGLCYSCDSKWIRGHVCVVPKLFLIEVLDEQTPDPEKTLGPTEEDPGEFFLKEFPKISLNAITSTPHSKTMRLVGCLQLQPVVILIDSDSPHNFVDTKLASTLDIQPLVQDAIQVKIANVRKLLAQSVVRKWR
jgi:hypothetical protein